MKVSRTVSLIFLLGLSLSQPAFAEQGRVTKTKGRQAIVEFSDGPAPKVGQTVYTRPPSRSSSGGSGTRDQVIGGSTEFAFLSNSRSSSNIIRLALSLRYGWNMQDFEAGPIVNVAYQSEGSTSTTRTLSGGGYVDWNMVPNVSGEESVFGLTGEGEFGQRTETTTSVENSYTTYGGFGGAFIKYFAFGNAVAFRGDAGIAFQSVTEPVSNYTNTGAKVRGGICVYF